MRNLILKWPELAAIALLAGLCLTNAATDTNAPRPNLTGRVEMSDGKAADATIFIYTAGPKMGSSTFCPSCYADCRKKAKTDANGDFKIEAFDPDLLFRILIVGDGCTPQFVAKVNPAEGPVYASLEKRDLSNVPPANMLHGRVVDPKGAPIEGATIEAHGIHDKNGGATWGWIDGLDPLAVTDAKGEFILTSRKTFASLDVKAEARGFANKTFTELTGGDTHHDLTMTEGATITGRVVWNGKPLPKVSVGIVSTDRSIENFTGNFEIGTDENGRFAFVNLPPNVHYTLSGIMATLKNYGSTTSQQVTAGPDGSTTEAGDIAVTPGHRLAGKVILDDKKPMPANTRLLLSLEGAWDNLQTTLDKDGSFAFTNLPSTQVNLSVRVSGYHISERNSSLEPMNDELVGRVDRDITNLTFLLEKGREPERDYNNFDGSDRPEQRPLTGIEGGGRPTEASWQISGRVLDGKTRQPVPSFTITPGRKQYAQIDLVQRDKVTGSNGVYSVALKKRYADPILKVEAPGYLTVAVNPPVSDRTDFDITLQSGSGPSGIVLTSGGKPAAGISVGLVCADQQGLGVRGDKLNSWRNKSNVQTTDADGHFAFQPELEMEDVVALSADGFKMVPIAELASNPKIILDAWGKIKGTLHRPSGPGTNEDLDLAFSSDVLKNQWSFNPGVHTVTDDKGAFEFDRVPPSKLKLSYRVKMGGFGNGWHEEMLQDVTVAPGQTMELKVEGSVREKADRSFAMVQRKSARRIGPPITGTVLLPDGKPASGAQVALVVSNEYLSLGKLTLRSGQDEGLKTVSGNDGHFTLPGVEGTTGLVAVSDAGFCHMEFEKAPAVPALNLQAWGEVHGTLHIGRRLGTNEEISLANGGFGQLMFDFNEFKSHTDNQGKFVITYVPPGEQYLARQISLGAGSWSQGSTTPITVKAGGITEVSIGGTGREVTGRAKFKTGVTNIEWKDVSFSMHQPYDPKTKPSVARRLLYYHSEPTTDGAFVFEDVLPGKYQIGADTRRKRNELNGMIINIIPLANKDVTIPDGGGPESKPYDTGTLELRQPHALNVGDIATDFDLTTVDGKEAHLTDFRGKFVLLHFFYPQMANPDSLSPLKTAFDSYDKEKQLTILGVSYAPAAFTKTFAEQNGIKWTLGSLANPMRSLDLADYMTSAVRPNQISAYLIGPDGKIVAKGIQGEDIKATLEKALAKR